MMAEDGQRRVLTRHGPKLRGEPTRFDARGLCLADGAHLPADVVVWATGYTTGLGSVDFLLDGQLVSDARDWLHPRALFHHCLAPSYPTLAVASHFFNAPGPIRGHALADYLVHHLCVRPPLPESVMHAAAGRNLVKTQPLDQGILSSRQYFSDLPTLWIDLGSARMCKRMRDGRVVALNAWADYDKPPHVELDADGEPCAWYLQNALPQMELLRWYVRSIVFGRGGTTAHGRMQLRLLPPEAAAPAALATAAPRVAPEGGEGHSTACSTVDALRAKDTRSTGL